MFLQCFADTTNNGSAKVAYIPFDTVLYINHTAVSVSSESIADEADDGITLAD